MMAFGHWLVAHQTQLHTELYSLSINRTMPLDAIRIKAGHLESVTFILQAFTDLYKGDLNKFMKDWLKQEPTPEPEDKESTNDTNTE
jgi:hypothetical protein